MNTAPSKPSIYIAGAMTNLNPEERHVMYCLYECLDETCSQLGCSVYLPHRDTERQLAPDASPELIYRISVEQAAAHDIVVAEVSHPSHGAGGELVAATEAGRSVVLLSRPEARVSSFVTGIPSVLEHIRYKTQTQACKRLRRVLLAL